MNGRTYVVILVFWALLTIITPMLIRLSGSANLYAGLKGEKREGVSLLLPRRALVQTIFSPAPAPAPAPSSGACIKCDEDRQLPDELRIHDGGKPSHTGNLNFRGRG